MLIVFAHSADTYKYTPNEIERRDEIENETYISANVCNCVKGIMATEKIYC